MLEGVDWLGEAEYTFRESEFVTAESLTVRTLLKTEERIDAEAILMAEQLMADADSEETFEQVVRDHTEDAGNPEENCDQKGQTVPEFEAAAFALQRSAKFLPQ